MHTFYAKGLTTTQTSFTMDEPTSKYCIQVLRMSIGDKVLLADGLGHKYTATISDDNRKKAVLRIDAFEAVPRVTSGLHIAIAFTKNVSRMEWFLEKAVEIGVTAITPLLTHRTEREKFKAERFENILVSAMLQSQQFWLPVLSEPTGFVSMLGIPAAQRFIAHCLPESKTHFVDAITPGSDGVILIGPEGDFTGDEITSALSAGFVPVSLGDTRLRTETAGMVAGALWAGANR
ncbi:16S rRNA (uracil(1498)-N(3))-methyltransferase [uncultured Chitinophaga sp.]|uniref:RsmE family RNA methyltransferase n=1 Tax=uncultured Chitinophaga sp. TaxID=339340 RepID=UPI0025E22DDD|nr:RsmE family RNA methyltransferase [uncultured Chitinophaga sp.]